MIKSIAEYAEIICIVCVIGYIIRLLLPDNSISNTVKTFIGLTLAAIVISMVVALSHADFAFDLENNEYTASYDDYITNKIIEESTVSVKEKVSKVLGQFGIKGGQISIDFNKEDVLSTDMIHISVGIPKSSANFKKQIKDLLNEKFDVFCDVYIIPEE